MKTASELITFIRSEFALRADNEKAPVMAAYMKTEMPFYGIRKPDRLPIYKELAKRFPPANIDDYQRNVKALWQLPHREEKYAAIDYAERFKKFVTSESMPLFEQMIRSGSWWDFVDPLAINLAGLVFLNERKVTSKIIDRWSGDDDFWIRRAALICHNHHKKETDEEQLFRHCLKLSGETEFFIRKGIGWALREYSYANPAAVKQFLFRNRPKLSPLSFREGAKQLIRSRQMD